MEAYVAPGSRFDRNPGESEEKYYHLTLLARNETGYRNLLKLVSQAYLEGFYHRPRMDKQLLAEHAEGIICLSGCLSSEIGVQLLAGQHDRALAVAGEYRDIFGADGYFIEMQDHGLADQRAILAKQVRARARHRRCRWSRPTTCTTRDPMTPSRTTSCCASNSRSCSRTRSV